MPPASVECTFVDIGGKKTQWTKGGSGQSLLYLHSAGGETEWMSFHQNLAQQFTVYLPAHPGFGLSEGLDQIDDMEDLVWHYVDLFDHFGLQQIPVVGFSLGAWLAVELAVRRPQLVGCLVLTAAAGLHVEEAPMAEFFIDDLDALRELVFYDPNHPLADQAMPKTLDDPRILNWIRARKATARIGWNPYLHNPKLSQHLQRVACPTLILWGREDKLIPLAHGKFYAKHIPDAQLKVFPQCGHMLPFEKADAFVQQTTTFVQQFLASTTTK